MSAIIDTRLSVFLMNVILALVDLYLKFLILYLNFYRHHLYYLELFHRSMLNAFVFPNLMNNMFVLLLDIFLMDAIITFIDLIKCIMLKRLNFGPPIKWLMLYMCFIYMCFLYFLLDTCFICALFMFHICALNVLYMCFICALYLLYMCFIYVLYMCLIYMLFHKNLFSFSNSLHEILPSFIKTHYFGVLPSAKLLDPLLIKIHNFLISPWLDKIQIKDLIVFTVNMKY